MMYSHHTHLSACLAICVCVWAQRLHLTQGKVSDACHGSKDTEKTFNVLKCERGQRICITEVRFFQWDGGNECSYQVAPDVKGKCCKRNDDRCSWTKADDVERFQKECSTKRQCRLHSLFAKPIATPCTDRTISGYSNVRSITYTCRRSACPRPPGTLPGSKATTTPESSATTRGLVSNMSREMTSATNKRTVAHGGDATTTYLVPNMSRKMTLWTTRQSRVSDTTTTNNRTVTYGGGGQSGVSLTPTVQPASNDSPNTNRSMLNSDLHSEDNVTGGIVGGVVGVLLVCAITLVIFVLLRRRTKESRASRTRSRDNDITKVPVVNRPRPGDDNVDSRYSFYLPDRDDNPTAWNRASDMYSQVNKPRDRGDNQGDVANPVAQTTEPSGHYGRLQGEGAHFRIIEDYDHVTVGEDVAEISIGRTNQEVRDPDVDMTYDRLKRGRDALPKMETEDDPYDVLKTVNTSPC